MQNMNTEQHQDLSSSHKTKSTFTKAMIAVLAITALSTVAYADEKVVDAAPAQGRVIEDSLVYDDPTVAKQSQWIYGGSIDFHDVLNAPATTYDTNHFAYASTNQYNMLGFSAFAGYGDFSLLGSYRQGTGTMTIPASTAGGWNFPGAYWNAVMSETEVDARWLVTQLKSTYFVPYVLLGYLSSTETDTLPTVLVNGIPEVNTGNTTGFIYGLGGIIPLSEKFGIRLDARQGNRNVTTTSPLAAFNGSYSYTGTRYTLTGYYNLNANWNAQLGARSDTQSGSSVAGSTTTGLYAMLGYTFR